MNLHRRSIRIVGATLLVYAVLVATHLGEFWPFSIYPMFSQAGNPWTRAVVREVPESAQNASWDATPFTDLPGQAFSMVPRGISQNDVSNYVSKTSAWTPERLRGLRSLFEANYDFEQSLLIYKVRGSLQGDSVAISATPVMMMQRDTTRFNPSAELAPRLAETGSPAP